MTHADPKKSTAREYYEALLIAVIFVNFARIFAFQAFKIPTGSMIDNLLIGDHIIVNKYIYGPQSGTPFDKLLPSREIKRGDVIVFRFPKDPSADYVKRAIGLPGETVTIRDKTVFIDGKPLTEPYVLHEDPIVFSADEHLSEPYRSRDQFGPYEVPPGEYFAMGDNRDRSNDSRYWGTVPRSLIKGRGFMVYWSFRGEPPPQGSPPGERLKELLRVFTKFFTNTRWDRTFLIVDSKYHYHPEPNSGYEP